MKSSQWIVAVLILGVMVFALTFSMNYLGGLNEIKPANVDKVVAKKNSDDDGIGQELSFLNKVFPVDGQSVLENEFKAGGEQDYWFTFDGNRPLKVGLDSKNCTCTSVQLFVPPQELVEKSKSDPMKLDPVWVEKLAKDNAFKKNLEGKSKSYSLDKNEEPFIKPGEAGWVRLKWKTEKMGPQRLAATIWFGKKGSGADSRLEAAVNVLPSLMMVENEKSVDVLSPLVPKKNVTFECFSSTRKHMEIIVRMSRPRPDETVIVGNVVPLNDLELAELEKKQNGMPVLSGFRIPVTVSYNVPGGKDLMELGPFSRQVEVLIISPKDKQPDQDSKVDFRVSGKVEGEFRVLDAEQKGRVSFGAFQRTLGAKREIKIETDLTGIELELDEKRTADFLKVKPSPGFPQDQSGRRTWKYQVDIPPGAISGPFPRDDEFFRDSAMYLKSKGPNSRSIRVPVEGRSDN